MVARKRRADLLGFVGGRVFSGFFASLDSLDPFAGEPGHSLHFVRLFRRAEEEKKNKCVELVASAVNGLLAGIREPVSLRC